MYNPCRNAGNSSGVESSLEKKLKIKLNANTNVCIYIEIFCNIHVNRGDDDGYLQITTFEWILLVAKNKCVRKWNHFQRVKIPTGN